MGKPFTILHISDLHRSSKDPISNDELISALVSDRDGYSHENPSIAHPEAIVVSGDVIQGVPLGTSNHESKITEQYSVAEEFLDELVRRFLCGDRSRLIIVPGNHDVDWNTAFAALEPIAKAHTPEHFETVLHSENSLYRWDWKTQTLYRMADPALYDRRMKLFWLFFERFYAGVPGLLKVRPGSDANLFALCDNRIGVAAFNSCHGNDCFAFHGLIKRDVIARSHLELDDSGHIFDLRMAVWHHSVEGAPYRTDYMDVDIVRGMIGRGFRLGLYGHQHKAQAIGHQVWLANQEKMAIVAAGSLCAGARELPTGVYRQYSILEIADDFRSVLVHVRAMSVANLFCPARLQEFGGKSFVYLDWTLPRNIAGAIVDNAALRKRRVIEDAEFAAKTGDPKQAVALLRLLPLTSGSYERELLLDASEQAQDWPTIVEITDPPQTIAELIQRVDALSRLGSSGCAIDTLERFSMQLRLPESIAMDLRAV